MAAEEGQRTVGQYLLGDTLGKGGYGKVKLGTDMETGEQVAIKFLKWEKHPRSGKNYQNLQREVEIMRRLDHPHVLKLKDVNWSAQYPKKRGGFREDIMLVLQLADGGELFSYLMHTGKFPETISRTFFQQMCDGLAYCHKEGVSHRDIKPENLLLTANFQLLLADFGLSSLKETETETADASGAHLLKTLCGTPQYMAPELNRNERYDGRAVDVWAAGVVLFIMHTGFPPLGEAIRGDWYYDRMRKNQMATFWKAHERSAQFSDSFKDLIEKIFVPDPAGRISIDEVKQHPWYTGEVVSQEVLSGELRRRKQQVAAAKRAERRKKQEEAAGRRGNFEEANYRAADLDTEAPALPASVALLPAFGMKRLIHSKLHEGHLVEAANTAFLDLQAKYKLPAGAAAGGGAAEGDAGDEAGAGAAEAAPAAAAAAEEPKVEFTAKKGEFKFKAAFPVSASESLKVSLQIFRQSKDMRAICLKRETGPMMKAEGVLDAIEDELAHLLVIAEEEDAAAAADGEAKAADGGGVLGAAADDDDDLM